MKIALIGYGKMGKLIEEIAQTLGHQIVSAHRIVSPEAVKEAEVCIDFSHPDVVLDHIETLAKLGKTMVIGTTGWYDHLDKVEQWINKYQVGCIYSPNFSLGVNVFLRIISDAASVIDQFEDYDVAGIEYHHSHKADVPSGTAKQITKALIDRIRRKKSIVYDLGNRKIHPDELHFSAVRCGSYPGTHEIVFDSSVDTIKLSHTARSREGFARGAVAAAEWIDGKKGLYHIQDMINMMVE